MLETQQTWSKTGSAPDSPLWPKAADRMKIDVTVNADAQVWVLHDQPFPDYLEWIEFDVPTGTMTFITAGGKLQDLGLTIYSPMKELVARANDICTIYLRDGQIRDMGMVRLVIRK